MGKVVGLGVDIQLMDSGTNVIKDKGTISPRVGGVFSTVQGDFGGDVEDIGIPTRELELALDVSRCCVFCRAVTKENTEYARVERIERR